MSWLDFAIGRLPELIIRTREHLFLTGISMGAAVLAGIPLGIYISGRQWIRSFVFGLAGIVQTVPSLAMLAFLLAMTGKIGVTPAVIALMLYALLPIIQNTVSGIEGVPPDSIEAARGMGMTPWQEMSMVKLPLSMPVMMAGVRTSAVICVGIATLSAFIGAGGLGEFINRGLALSNTKLILLGAIPAAILALYVSFAISALQWGMSAKRRRRVPLLSGRAGMYLSFIPILSLVVLGFGGINMEAGKSGTVRIGSKNFTEQLILGEMMARMIEEKTDLSVERSFNLGGTMICHEALLSGEIDVYPEYTGTGLLAILKSKSPRSDPEKAYDVVSREYTRRFGLLWLGEFGFNNTYALAVLAEDAKANGWKRISDLKPVSDTLSAGFTSEFAERPDGYPGLREAYGFTFGKVFDMDPSLMYSALEKGEVDVITAFSTDGRIPAYGLTVLEDDRGFFPPYYAAPVIRKDTLDAHPEILDALEPLEGLIGQEAMQSLNYKVDEEKRPVAEVVEEFLREKGLVE